MAQEVVTVLWPQTVPIALMLQTTALILLKGQTQLCSAAG